MYRAHRVVGCFGFAAFGNLLSGTQQIEFWVILVGSRDLTSWHWDSGVG